MDHVTLLGAEEVSRAARSIVEAAERIHQAACYMEDVMHRQRDFMDDWLVRLEAVMKLTDGKGAAK